MRCDGNDDDAAAEYLVYSVHLKRQHPALEYKRNLNRKRKQILQKIV